MVDMDVSTQNNNNNSSAAGGASATTNNNNKSGTANSASATSNSEVSYETAVAHEFVRQYYTIMHKSPELLYRYVLPAFVFFPGNLF